MLKNIIQDKISTKGVVYDNYEDAYNAWQDDMEMCVVEDTDGNAVHVLVKDRETIDKLITLNNCGRYTVFYVSDKGGNIPHWAEGMDIVIGRDDWFHLFG